MPTRLSIGDRNPCVDRRPLRSGGDDTASATEKSSRQLSALDRIPRSIQSALSFSHREHPTSVWDLYGDTVIDAVSQIPTRSPQSLKKPHCSRAFAQKAIQRTPQLVVVECSRPRREGISKSGGAIDSMTGQSCARAHDTPQPFARIALSYAARRLSSTDRTASVTPPSAPSRLSAIVVSI